QAADGIRDFHVTGVQTCALPICFAEENLARAEEKLGEKPAPNAIAALPEAVKPEMERAVDYARQVSEILAEGQRECLGIGKTWQIGRASCRAREQLAARG